MSTLTDDQLIAALDETRKRRVAEIEADYQRDVAAIRRVKELRQQTETAGGNGSASEVRKADNKPRSLLNHPGEAWPGLRTVILHVANEGSEFGIDKVLEYIKANFPSKFKGMERVAVSRELWRAKEAGLISIEREGAGKRPAIYKVAPKQTTNGAES